MTKTHVRLPGGAAEDLEAFVGHVDDRLSGPEDDDEVVAETLAALHGDLSVYRDWRDGADVDPVERARLRSYDPRSATLESEYYADKDPEAFARSKPLQYLWRGFDRTPLSDNVAFALRFRGMLAGHLFASAGDDLRIFKGVTMTYGHNIEVGDNVVIHDDVHLDDRGSLTLGDRVSVADGTHVYSHSHDVVDQTEVTNYRTVIEDDVRLGYDSVVQAGSRVGKNAMLGSRALLRGTLPAHHVAVGAPAKSVRVKPGWESVAASLESGVTDDRADRALPSEVNVPEEEVFDEFGRELRPPDADPTDAPDADD